MEQYILYIYSIRERERGNSSFFLFLSFIFIIILLSPVLLRVSIRQNNVANVPPRHDAILPSKTNK